MSGTGYDVYENLAKHMMVEYQKKYGDKNYVFSPLSILMILAMAVKSTGSETQMELTDFMVPSGTSDELKLSVREYTRLLANERALRSVNAVAINKTWIHTISSSYRKEITKDYGVQLFTSEHIERDVNLWAAAKTNGMIKNVIDSLPEDTMLVMLNAVYFKSKWKDKYKAVQVNENEAFYNADGSIGHITMLNSVERGYVENQHFEGFIKPYKCGFSFMGLLPKKEGDSSFLEKALQDTDISEMVRDKQDQEVWVKMPEFACDGKAELQTMLEDLGVRRVFQRHADFSPISTEDILMGGFIHQARIEVDRNGTKAEAVTISHLKGGCILEPKRIELDHPFIYAVVHNETGLPIFEGMVSHLD